jgi:hypothetical protein
MKLYWDLDGVLRNLHSSITGWDPQYWDHPLPNGQNIFEYFRDNPHHLVYAEPTEYYKIVPKDITIITCQPEEWRPYTSKWITVYFPQALVIYVDKSEQKLEYLKEGDLLIEDYPLFDNYKQVVLISRAYNKEVNNCYLRINTPNELKDFLEKLNEKV